uniref:phosphoethanolamine N-methyltransferase n=1 Tax=Eptatretus burgeri TaxID=7764 RepID=A0A8C4QTT0_EPTBU
MLGSEANLICSEEDLEMLSLLPPLDGLHVLELGAGISPFTEKIADSAARVTTVDCANMFFAKKLSKMENMRNVEHLQADVTKLDFPKTKFDLIISSFQFMHLEDEELKALTACLIRWLRPGGHLFFHEFCSRQPDSTSSQKTYRKQADYNRFMQETTEGLNCEAETMHGFDLVFSKCMNLKHKEERLHFCWLLKKVIRTGNNCSLEEFLEKERFSRRKISHIEWMYGQGFLSAGGLDTTQELMSLLNLKPGEKVLDIGCGIGGPALYMAKAYGVEVLGIDLCLCAIEIAQNRLMEKNVPKVQFELCDATMREFPENSFDVVYSKESILYILDKLSLFQKLHRWLKPTGRFLILDYCSGEQPMSEDFQKFVNSTGFQLLAVPSFTKYLETAGFADVHVTDYTPQFVKHLKNELMHVKKNKEEFIKNFSKQEYDDNINVWKGKIQECEAGGLTQGLFQGTKRAVNNSVLCDDNIL